MSDIAERLRKRDERLERENERLRAALAEIAALPDEGDEWVGRDYFRDARWKARDTLGMPDK